MTTIVLLRDFKRFARAVVGYHSTRAIYTEYVFARNGSNGSRCGGKFSSRDLRLLLEVF